MKKINWKKSLPIIFGVAGAIGTVGAVIFSAKDTVKAQKRLREAEEAKGEPLTKKERFKVAAPCYIRTAVVTTAAVGCEVASVATGEKIRGELLAGTAYAIRKINEVRENAPEEGRAPEITDLNETLHVHESLTDQEFDTTLLELYLASILVNRSFNSDDEMLRGISLAEVLEYFENADSQKLLADGSNPNDIGWTAHYLWNSSNMVWLDLGLPQSDDFDGTYELTFSAEPKNLDDLIRLMR